MDVNQQPPPNIYAPSQQQPTFNNRRNRRNGGGHGNGGTGGNNSDGGGNFPQQRPTWFGGNGADAQQPTRPPTPYTSVGKIGTTAILMVVTWMTPT